METIFRQLFDDSATPEQSLLLLAELGFQDPSAAWKRLRWLQQAGGVPQLANDCLSKLLAGMRDTPLPDTALLSFERYLSSRSDVAVTYRNLCERPRAIEILLKLFIGSQYLTETLLRSPDYLEQLTQHRQLADIKSREDFLEGALEAASHHSRLADQLDALRKFQRWEILRIGVCDNVGLIDLRAATVQLSLLADGLIHACLKLDPQAPENLDELVILGMGKLGGEELNYSSDIDLIFLAADRPERFIPVAQRLIRALQSATSEGFLYRVDMRLRPWGRAGALVTSTRSFVEYLRKDSELWERQALLKARQISGRNDLGRAVLEESRHLVFGDDPQAVRESVRSAKQKIEAALDKRGQRWGEVKSGTGSIRDIEFLTQYLQLIHGALHPQLRTPNTLEGLIRLTDAGLLQADEYRHLTGGYVFLRTIEHALQLMHNKQVHRLPDDSRELNILARRLDFPHGEAFVAHYERHCRAIRKIYDRHLGDHAAAVVVPVAALSVPGISFTEAECEQHRALLMGLTEDRNVEILPDLQEGPRWKLTVVGVDQPGDLSIICGLLFVYGFDILGGVVTTGRYPETWSHLQHIVKRKSTIGREQIRDFVNVFTVRPPLDITEADVWVRYRADLVELCRLLRAGKDGEAQGRLAKRVAAALEEPSSELVRLSPVDVQIENSANAAATVLQIRADDTPGFLYELANALSLSTIDIQQVEIGSDGQRVFDRLLVTDARTGGKITDPARLEQLQVAVVLIKHFTHLLPNAPNPEAALLHFRSFVQELFHQPNWGDEWSALESPEVLDALARLLGVSDFLWEDVLRLQYANLLPLLRDQDGLHHRKDRVQFSQELTRQLADAESKLMEWTQSLNEFKDREMFRTDMRHILGHVEKFEDFSAELTDLAEVVVETAAARVSADLQRRYGQPRDHRGQAAGLIIAALGKCGGRELGFASDIELLFVYSAEGLTDGREPVANSAYYQRFVEQLMQAIRARREGVFHIDLRLRPYGNAGALAISLQAFQQYYCLDGPAWPYERQALVKLRPISGDPELAAQLIAIRDGIVFTGQSLDAAALRAMRERQVRQLVKAGTFHAKLSPGGLVDLEYLIQAMQIAYGHRWSELRTSNTHSAILALTECERFQPADGQLAATAYLFFRRLIDALRMVRGDARDLTVPSVRSEEFEFLTRRLGRGGDVSSVKRELEYHSSVVTDLFRRYLPDNTEATTTHVPSVPALPAPASPAPRPLES